MVGHNTSSFNRIRVDVPVAVSCRAFRGSQERCRDFPGRYMGLQEVSRVPGAFQGCTRVSQVVSGTFHGVPEASGGFRWSQGRSRESQ